MSTPPHLQQIPLVHVLHLSQRAGSVRDLVNAMQAENQSFLISQTHHDAGRVAKILRFIAREAEAAASAFEAAAKTKDKDNGNPEA